MEDRELFEFMDESDQDTAEMLLLIKQALIDKPRSQATREIIISAINSYSRSYTDTRKIKPFSGL
jgi:hypothetical protein